MFGNKYKQLYQESMLQMQGLVDKINSGYFNPVKIQSLNKIAYTTMLQSKDLMMCANRYVWDGIPTNITSQQIEALLYQYGSLCMFENDKGEIIFSRYTMIGQLNPYGLMDKIQPIDFSGKAYDRVRSVIHSSSQNPLKQGEPFAVIVNDYTTLTQLTDEISRAHINSETTIKDQVEVYSQLMNNIILSIKKALALCENEDQKEIVSQQVQELLDPDKTIVAVSGSRGKAVSTPIQMFNFGNNFDCQNYCQTIEFYDKVRRGFDGIPAPDTFEKKERMITSEAENNGVDTNIVLLDGYLQRFNALELFKKYCKNEENKSISVRIQDELNPQKKEEEEGGNEDDSNGQKEQVRHDDNA